MMKKFFPIFLLHLCAITSFAQSKKDQIETLTSQRDSVRMVLDAERILFSIQIDSLQNVLLGKEQDIKQHISEKENLAHKFNQQEYNTKITKDSLVQIINKLQDSIVVLNKPKNTLPEHFLGYWYEQGYYCCDFIDGCTYIDYSFLGGWEWGCSILKVDIIKNYYILYVLGFESDDTDQHPNMSIYVLLYENNTLFVKKYYTNDGFNYSNLPLKNQLTPYYKCPNTDY
jgi:hypothetical protein